MNNGSIVSLMYRSRVTVHRNWLSCGIPALKCGNNDRLDFSLVGIGNSFFNPKDGAVQGAYKISIPKTLRS